MAKNFTLASGGDDLSSAAEDSGVFDQTNVIESGATTRACIATQSEELANVGEKEIGVAFFLFVPVFKIEDFPLCHPGEVGATATTQSKDLCICVLAPPGSGHLLEILTPPFRLRITRAPGWANFCSAYGARCVVNTMNGLASNALSRARLDRNNL